MAELIYPLRVVFYGGTDDDGVDLDVYEEHGPFKRPGELWMWANRECFLTPYQGWREDMNDLIRENAPRGLRRIMSALDEWAIQDLEEDYPGASQGRVLQGDKAWREWQSSWQDEDRGKSVPPDGWRPIGPVSSCGCEDWPCCIHADDYASVPF